MKRLAYTSILIALLTSTASVQAQAPQRQGAGPAARISTSIPASSMTVTHWYKQNVYDPGDNKIGEIKDVLVDRDGKITALIVAAGGFLGMGEKDVAVPFNAVQVTSKDNNKWYLVMNSTKDALKTEVAGNGGLRLCWALPGSLRAPSTQRRHACKALWNESCQAAFAFHAGRISTTG